MVFPVFFGFILLFMPDSPVWLRRQQRYEEAEKSEAWLKLPSPLSIPTGNPIAEIKLSLEENINRRDSIQSVSVFFTRPVVMPLFIALSLLVLQQISGIDAIIFFTVEIFRASGTG